MKKLTFLLTIAATVAAVGFAKVHAVKTLATASEPQVMDVKFDMPRDLNSQSVKAPARAAEDYVIITEQPQGELKTYQRTGGYYFVQGSQLAYGNQSGTIDIVWGDDNKVYFKDILNGTNFGSWVEGTLSEDGTTITLPLKQNLVYASQYDACVALTQINYGDQGFVVDEEAAEATFTVDENGVIALQGTGFTSVSLGANWTDDASIQVYGDYETVFTPYVPNLELVTLPEGARAEEMPYEAVFYSNASSSAVPVQVTKTVNVALVGDEVYIQGMSNEFPEAWLKGTVSGDNVVIPVTYMGDLNGQHVWACGYNGGIAEINLVYDAERNTYELMGYLMQSYSEISFDASQLAGYYQAGYIGTRPDPIMLPEGLKTVDMPYNGQIYDGSNTADFKGTVKVAVDGQNVYIQGLVSLVPEAWIMGTFNEDGTTLTIPAGQYVGYCNYGSVYLLGQDGDNVADITFTYDKDQNTYTLNDYAYINGKKNEFYYYNVILPELIIGTPSDAMWIAAEQNYEDQQDVFDITIDEGTTGHIEQGTSPNAPKYYSNGVSLRMYAGHEFTITSDKPMIKILITMDHASANQQVLEANVGNYSLENNVGTWTGESEAVTFTVPAGKQARISKIQIYYLDYATSLVTVPQDLETEEYRFDGYDTYANSDEVHPVQVGFDDDYVYIQGLSKYLPSAWVRGEIKRDDNGQVVTDEDGKVTYVFPGWLLGTYTGWISMDLNFSGCEMTYDPQADEFYCDAFTTVNPADAGFAWDEYSTIFIYKVQEVEATPMDPEIVSYNPTASYPNIRLNIPLLGTNNEPLLESFVTYVLYVVKDDKVIPLVFKAEDYEGLTADMVEIPYTFTDNWDISQGGSVVYLNQADIADWTNIGVQVIYSGGGVEHASNIVWYYDTPIPSAVDEIATEQQGQATYFDLQGRQVDENATGIVIKQTRDQQGNVIKVEKILK